MTEKPKTEPEKESAQVKEEKGQYKRQISLIVNNSVPKSPIGSPK